MNNQKCKFFSVTRNLKNTTLHNSIPEEKLVYCTAKDFNRHIFYYSNNISIKTIITKYMTTLFNSYIRSTQEHNSHYMTNILDTNI